MSDRVDNEVKFYVSCEKMLRELFEIYENASEEEREQKWFDVDLNFIMGILSSLTSKKNKELVNKILEKVYEEKK